MYFLYGHETVFASIKIDKITAGQTTAVYQNKRIANSSDNLRRGYVRIDRRFLWFRERESRGVGVCVCWGGGCKGKGTGRVIRRWGGGGEGGKYIIKKPLKQLIDPKRRRRKLSAEIANEVKVCSFMRDHYFSAMIYRDGAYPFFLCVPCWYSD